MSKINSREENTSEARREVINERRVNRQERGLDIDLFKEARRMIGLYPVKARHIIDFHEGEYTPCVDDIEKMDGERELAARDFLKKELKWSEETEIITHWSQNRNVLWVTMKDENLVSSIFKRQKKNETEG